MKMIRVQGIKLGTQRCTKPIAGRVTCLAKKCPLCAVAPIVDQAERVPSASVTPVISMALAVACVLIRVPVPAIVRIARQL